MANEVRSQKAKEASELASSVGSSVAKNAAFGHYAYHEIASDRHLVRVDVLEQLKSNIAQLEDLHGRLRFMMGEVRSLLKRN